MPVAEFFELDTTTGKAMAGMLSVFSEFERDMLRQRIKAGIAQSNKKGRLYGRPRNALDHAAKSKRFYSDGMTKTIISRKLKIGRTSVIRSLDASSKIAKQFVKSHM